jgi:serine/threonine-protein kinase PRP4
VDGYYQARVGEVLDGRYEVFATHGRGVFSSVLRARDAAPAPGDPDEVALKVIRANDTMTKAAQQEVVILRKLAGADPENRRHCVRLLRTFEYRSHTFLVFESLAMNLREVLKKYGRNVGLSIGAVHAYAQQLLIALKHLRNCGVLHADIKPDNVLVTERHNVLKLADFGSAMFDGDNEITPYLVSRFYRAPEIILGLKYSHPLDMWSVGCVLYELYMGAMAFPGRSNNEMLKLMMEVKGPFPRKMVRKAAFRDRHFDGDMTFGVIEQDALTQRDVRRLIRDAKPTKDLAATLGGASKALSDADRRRVAHLADLLDKMWALDPAHRITVAQALMHPFVKETGPPPGAARP